MSIMGIVLMICLICILVMLLISGVVLNIREERDTEYTFPGTSRGLNGRATIYERYVKRFFDIVFSAIGMIVLSPLMLISVITVYIEDPGNVIFKQKRVGINKSYFNIHKLRSMRQDTPDIPTHLVENPEQYILKTGKIYRKTSVDEIFQLYDILRGRMSFVGPRPALWNQDDLIAERDKYGANDVRPGLTGWAQVNGRDELEIAMKAKYDGEYRAAIRKDNISGIVMDLKCFLYSFYVVFFSKGVSEGGCKR